MENNNRKKLHLGCGRMILNGWINLDKMNLPGVDVVADLDDCKNTPLPFEDDSIDEMLCSHTIEHLQNTLPFMEELYRIAKPDATAIFLVPYGSSDAAFEDPTHVRPYFLHSFEYFSQPCYWRADYGYRGDWQVDKIDLLINEKPRPDMRVEEYLYEISRLRNTILEMTVRLHAVKPAREPKKEFEITPKVTVMFQKKE
jgi:SAM-dependent methyltransferase